MMRSFIVFCLSVASMSLLAQPNHDLQEGLIDYPVPIPAAYTALQLEPLLEPSTVRPLSFAFGTWFSDTSTAAAFEIAPILATNAISLSEYLSGRLIRVLLRTRLSVAANFGEGGSSYALGLRFMLHDDADLRADSLYQRWLLLHGNNTEAIARDPLLQQGIDSLREVFKETYWNKSVFEIAAAAVYHSIGGMDLAIRSYHGYGNFGYPVFGTNGQVVLGFSGWAGRPISSYERHGSLVARLYYGSANERLFLETLLNAANNLQPDYRLGIGSVGRLANGLWLRLAVGASLAARFTPSAMLNLTFGTPESQ